jgi:hypothetical protein
MSLLQHRLLDVHDDDDRGHEMGHDAHQAQDRRGCDRDAEGRKDAPQVERVSYPAKEPGLHQKGLASTPARQLGPISACAQTETMAPHVSRSMPAASRTPSSPRSAGGMTPVALRTGPRQLRMHPTAHVISPSIDPRDGPAPSGVSVASGGYADLGVANRWRDVAVGTWSTTWNFGPDLESLFLDAYGAAPNPDRQAFYRLLYDLAS